MPRPVIKHHYPNPPSGAKSGKVTDEIARIANEEIDDVTDEIMSVIMDGALTYQAGIDEVRKQIRAIIVRET